MQPNILNISAGVEHDAGFINPKVGDLLFSLQIFDHARVIMHSITLQIRDGVDIRYGKRKPIEVRPLSIANGFNTVFVPWGRFHTQISHTAGYMSMIVLQERRTSLALYYTKR